MEIGPIFRALMKNKTRLVLITLEVALTLAIVVNCVNMMLEMQAEMDKASGLDEQNILVISSTPFAEDFKEEGYFDNQVKADLELLRSLPGVTAAEAFSAVPLSGSGSSSGYKPLGSEANTLETGFFETGLQGVDALGVRLIQGRNFTIDDVESGAAGGLLGSKSRNVLVTKAYADKLFPDGDALGKQIQGRDPENPHTIVGIIDHMLCSWPTWSSAEHVTLFPGKPGSFNWGSHYLVRTAPGRLDSIFALAEEKLLERNDGRNVRLESMTEVKADTFDGNIAVIKMLRVVIALLALVTALGIVGITSFSVTERVHHIGTRRALGATRLDILRYFLTENWLITSLGLALGLVLTYGLNYILVSLVSGAKLSWYLPWLGVLIMWIVGQLSALVPALRGARIPPALATRSV